jgi:hypothetical protein
MWGALWADSVDEGRRTSPTMQFVFVCQFRHSALGKSQRTEKGALLQIVDFDQRDTGPVVLSSDDGSIIARHDGYENGRFAIILGS